MTLQLHAVIFVVCLQVYNEQIRDLLANSGPLAVREDSSKGVVVQGLTLHQVSRFHHPPERSKTMLMIIVCVSSLCFFLQYII